MSKLFTLDVKDVSVLLFFFSNPVDITFSLQLEELNLTLALIAPLCFKPADQASPLVNRL
jgi:hypothetical protein